MNAKTEQFAYPIRTPHNRYEKRLAYKEGTYINKHFDKVEQGFYKILFDEDISSSYLELYNLYKSSFNEVCESISGKTKFFRINEQYFANQYKPE